MDNNDLEQPENDSNATPPNLESSSPISDQKPESANPDGNVIATPTSDSVSDNQADTDLPIPPTSTIQPPTQVAATPQPATNQSHTDGLGIASLIMAFTGLTVIGFILGLIGASKAKKEGHSPTLSRVGWIINLVFMLAFSLLFAGLVFANFGNAQPKARDTERITDVNSLHSNLEEFYAINGFYPPEANQTNLPNVDPEAFKDPKGGNYTYTPSPNGCKECASYTLSAHLETNYSPYPGKTYVKQSLNDVVDKSYLMTPTVPTSKL